METILITGGAGAIGSFLANTLLERGNRVIVLDDLSSSGTDLLLPGVEFHLGSVVDNSDLEKVFANKIDLVFHLAALFANQNSVEHPDKDIVANGLGTINVLKWATDQKVRKLLYTSSSCVYGNQPNMTEDGLSNPSCETPYAITKYIGEQYCRFWSEHHRLNTVMVRLFNSYGPGDYPGKFRSVVPNFMQLAMSGQPLIITGTGDESRDFNYVADTVQGLDKAMYCDTENAEIFNIASGHGTSILDLANMMTEICQSSTPHNFKPRRQWDQVSRRVGVIDKAVKKLNYEPTTSLFDGLVSTRQWFLDNNIK